MSKALFRSGVVSVILLQVVLSAPDASLAAQDLQRLAAIGAEMGQSLLDRRANLDVQQVTLEAALDELRSSSRASLAFSPSLLHREPRVSCSCRMLTVGEALDRLLAGTNLRYVPVREQILIEPARPRIEFPTRARPTTHLATLQFHLRQPSSFPLSAVTEVVQGTLAGRVTSASTGQALAGVRIVVMGTGLGAVTNADGRYTITGVPAGTHQVRVSHLGYTEQTQAVTVTTGQTATVNLALTTDVVELEGIVAIGYGTQRRRDVTGAVSSVDTREIANMPITAVQEGLQGRVAGVQVVQNEGAPGANYTVRIRGGNSMLGSNDPLYVIDGFPATSSGILNNINPHDIESIEILKDASATAIYGSRGANGVVIISTKKGAVGTNRVEFDAYTGVQSITRTLPLLNGPQFAELANELARNERQQIPFPNPAAVQSTDWQEAFFEDAPISSYTASFSGGDERTRYLVSGNYLDQDGIVPTTYFERGSLRLNLDREMSSRFRVANQVMLSRSMNREVPTTGEGIIMDVLGAPPTEPVFNEDGTYSNVTPYFFSPDAIEHPLAGVYERTDKTTENRLLGSVTAEYKPVDGLTARVLLGADYIGGKGDFYATRLIRAGGTGGSAGARRSEALSYLNENTLTYDGALGDAHRVNATGGFTWQRREFNSLNAGTSGFVTDDLLNNNLGSGELVSIPSTNVSDWKLLSWLGRVNYTLHDRYLFTFTARTDGSSRFGKDHKWGFFPSAAFAWRVSDESFLRDQAAISNLKLRLSWGQTGNQEIGLYQSLQQVRAVSSVIGDLSVVGFAPGNIANPELRWETTEQIDLGMDLGLWDERVRVTGDLYRKNTTDLLAQVQLPPSSGFGSMLQNVGGIRNSGVELGVGADLLRGGRLTWGIDANIAANRNEVTEVAGGNEFFAPPVYHLIGSVQVIREGQPMSAFNVLQENGIDANGRISYVDQNGDGNINDLDRVLFGDPNPDYTFGVSTNLSLGPFNASALLQGVQGVEIFNANLYQIASSMHRGTNQIVDVMGNYWSPQNPNPDAKYPKIALSSNFRPSDRFVEDGSFLRLKSVQLGYNLPVDRVSVLRGVSNASLYLAGQNLWTSTDYTWYDPEVSAWGDNLRPGVDFFSYPKSRTVTLGMRVGF